MQALTEMAPQQIAGALRSAYEQHFGAPCWGVNWDSVDIEEVRDSPHCDSIWGTTVDGCSIVDVNR